MSKNKYSYVVQFSHLSGEGEGLGHTASSTFNTRHEAIGWMEKMMNKNPEVTYRLDVYDKDKGVAIIEGTPKVGGSEIRYPPGTPTPADEVITTSNGTYIIRVGEEPIKIR